MGRTSAKGAVSLLLALALLPSSALADTTRFGDLDDTPGKFDIRTMMQGHAQEAVIHRIGTYERWRKGAFGTRNDSNFINFFFDTDNDNGFERRLTVDVDRNRRLTARMMDWETREFLDTVAINRPTRRSLKLTIPTALLGPGVSSYRWRSGSFFHADNRGPCGTPSDVVISCTDRFPDRGLATHNL